MKSANAGPKTARAWLAATLALCLLPCLAVAAPPAGLRIMHHQALKLLSARADGRAMSFDAYGRRFELRLEKNDRMRFVDPVRTPGVEALRGTVDGAPGSWVRLTRTPAGLYGMLSDGESLYVIEPAAAAARHAVGPVEGAGTAPVIYRLADTLMPTAEASCGVVTLDNLPQVREQTGEQAFAALSAELAALPATATRQIEVAVVGDFEFGGLSFAGGATPEATIAARMNIVDGIYSAQLGIKVVVGSVTVFRDANDPFTTTTSPSTLLTELGNWRNVTAGQRARGLTHLLTGRDLDGTTVGIAYLGSLCSARFGAGLTQGTLSEANSALVIAHEMGHNFGAPHDGETGSACEATAQTFLMAPRLNGSNTFSQCSLDRMSPVTTAAACVVALTVPDADLDMPVATRRLRGQAFDYTFNVRSIGATTVEGLVANVTLPSGVTANSTSVAGGTSCTPGAGGTLACSVGSLASGSNRAITLNLTAQASGAPVLRVALASSNDAFTSNNSNQVTLTIDPSADLAVSVAAAPASFTAGGSTQVTATVQHTGGDAVSDARLSFELADGLTASAVAANGLGCSLAAGTVACNPTALAAGTSQSVTVTIGAASVGNRILRATVTATLGDPVSANNAAQATLDTTAVPVASGGGSGGGGGGGGGGAPGLGALLVLAAWRAWTSVVQARARRARCGASGEAGGGPQVVGNTP